ncbi:DUF3592 domain-containing protein [Dactylosporangium sp. NPDC000244]|uniref:DUF3592 domain-containing protein n=1 Tax=Dactylosporangium sp. NPDC000244 TaxID=3154365 RepID=UPI003330569D
MWLLISLGAVVIGTIVTVSGIKRIKSSRKFRARAVRVNGMVVDNMWRQVDGSDVAMPVYDYHTREGHPMRATEQVGTNPPRYRPGTPVVVLYDPAEPYRAQLEGMAGATNVLHGVFVVIGPLVAIVGVASLAINLML